MFTKNVNKETSRVNIHKQKYIAKYSGVLEMAKVPKFRPRTKHYNKSKFQVATNIQSVTESGSSN